MSKPLLQDCLEQIGLTDNTLMVVATDHGELLGAHGMWGKGGMDESREPAADLPRDLVLLLSWP